MQISYDICLFIYLFVSLSVCLFKLIFNKSRIIVILEACLGVVKINDLLFLSKATSL